LKKQAQTLVEVVFILPILLIVLFGVLEYGVYYRNLNLVQDIANESAVIVAKTTVLNTMTATNLADTSSSGMNAAVLAVISSITKRRGQLGLKSLTFNYANQPYANNPTSSYNNNAGQWGSCPNTIYQLDSVQTRTINGTSKPIVSIIIDYRSPDTDGISVQVMYWHRTLLLGAKWPVLGGPPIVILPRDIQIFSTNVKQSIIY
jgi:Flp pilus assembly protein TadG